MTWVDKKEQYEEIVNGIDGSIKLTTKDGWFWKFISWVLVIVTFGKFTRKMFLTQYATTIGPIQAYPKEFPSLSEAILVHESRHTKQARWFGLGIHPWIGLPFMAIAYVFLFFPIGLALFRYLLELDADKASWKYLLKNKMVSDDYIRVRANRFAEKIAGSPYALAWPKKFVVKGFKKAAEKIIKENNIK